MIVRLRATLLAAVAAMLLAGGWRASAAAAFTFPLTVGSRTLTQPLPPSFLGLALEYGTVPAWTSAQGQDNPILPVLLRNLDPSGRPSIRIGGQSTDRSWWPVPGLARPVGVTQSLGASWIRAARLLVRETDADLLLGVNLEAGNPEISQVEADRLVAGIGTGNIEALELGNEPDLYQRIPWYRVADDHILPWYAKVGAPEYSRALGWGPADYAAQVASFASRLPDLPLAGPDTVAGPWTTAFAGLSGDRVGMLTAHAYGLNQCVTDPALPGYPSIPNLLSLHASRGMFEGIPGLVALAHRDEIGDRIDELGSVTCNGRPGVSNTFASALWAMDALFDAARNGLDGVNLHSYPNSSNGLFDFTYSPATRRWRATIHPIYDGALMFAQAAPTGSRLLHLLSGPQTLLRAWATIGTDRDIRVLLINDSENQPAQIRLRVPAGYDSSTASLERLTAPGPGATGGITIGGRPFSATSTGELPPPRLQSIAPEGELRTLTVGPASAALIVIPPDAAASRSRALGRGYSCQSVSLIQAICLRSSLPTVSTW